MSTIPANHKPTSELSVLAEEKVCQLVQELGLSTVKEALAAVEVKMDLLNMPDIWIDNIFPFLGPGHYIYVAGTCRKLKKYYLKFFSTIAEKDLPKVIVNCSLRKAKSSDTFYSAVFSSVNCLLLWDDTTKNDSDRLPREMVCREISKHGSLVTLKWVHTHGYPWDKEACNGAALNGRPVGNSKVPS